MANITNFFLFDSTRDKLLALSEAFQDAIRRVVNSEDPDFNDALDQFESNLTTIIVDNTIGEAIQTLFDAYELVGQTPSEQYILAIQLFTFGSDDTFIDTNPTNKSNLQAINNVVQIDALAIAYNNAVQIEFLNQEELDAVQATLDLKYQVLIDADIDSDTRISLLDLRTIANQFFSQLDLRSIISVNTTQIPSTVLSYKFYKTSANANQIIKLNKIQNTGFIAGDISIISTDEGT